MVVLIISKMNEKRFTTNGYYINDTYNDGEKLLVNEVEVFIKDNKIIVMGKIRPIHLCFLNEDNEQLKKEYKIAIDEMVTDYKKLEKENEQLKSRIAFFEEQEDEFEKYTAQTIQNMIADYREG